MKIAISTLPFRSWSLEEVLNCCKNAGYDALEVRMDFHSWSDSALPDEHYQNVYRQVKEAGLCISNLGSGIVLKEDSEDDLKELERAFAIADLLHTKGVRIMLGHVRLSRLTPKLPLEIPAIMRWLARADALAGKYRKEVWIETHNEFATGRSLAQIFRQFPFENTRVIWDIMHPLEQGEPIEETMALLYAHLAHVHIKDGLPWEDPEPLIWKYTRMGEGIIPVSEILAALDKAGYNGYCSLEWESAWRKELAALNCDREEIQNFPQYLRSIAGTSFTSIENDNEKEK